MADSKPTTPTRRRALAALAGIAAASAVPSAVAIVPARIPELTATSVLVRDVVRLLMPVQARHEAYWKAGYWCAEGWRECRVDAIRALNPLVGDLTVGGAIKLWWALVDDYNAQHRDDDEPDQRARQSAWGALEDFFSEAPAASPDDAIVRAELLRDHSDARARLGEASEDCVKCVVVDDMERCAGRRAWPSPGEGTFRHWSVDAIREYQRAIAEEPEPEAEPPPGEVAGNPNSKASFSCRLTQWRTT